MSFNRTYVIVVVLALVGGLGCCEPCFAKWDMAYVARFYYPPGGKRISHSQVYLSDIHGRHRKQLTFGYSEPSLLQWTDRDHLAWLETKEGRTVINMLDLRSWKVQTFAGFKEIEYPGGDWIGFDGVSTGLDGMPVYMIDGSLKELTPEGFRNTRKKGLRDNRIDNTESGEVWHIPGQPSMTFVGYEGHPFSVHLPDGRSDDHELGRETWTRLGKKYTFEFPGCTSYILPGRNQDHAWILTGSYAASAGTYEFLFDFDWRTGKARRIVDGLREIAFDPNGRYFSALEGGRSHSKYGSRRRVWTSSIYVGELATGRMWPIASGLVFGESVRLRPSR